MTLTQSSQGRIFFKYQVIDISQFFKIQLVLPHGF